MGQVHCECLRRETEVDHAQAAVANNVSGIDVDEAVRLFRNHCQVSVSETSGANGEPLGSAACDLVDAILCGVKRHLPTARAKCSIVVPAASSGGNESSGAKEVVVLTVKLNPAPIIGEVATPSRFCHEIRLLEEVRFALEAPKAGSPVVLRVQGLELPPLPEMPGLRARIKSATGSGFNPTSAFKWWVQNKDEMYPLEQSKFHRMYESLWGTRATSMLPNSYRVDYLWAFLHGTHCHLDAFIFQPDIKTTEVRVTAIRKPGQTDEEQQLLDVSAPIARQALIENRTSGEKIASSCVHFAAMVYGPDVGQQGGSARVLTKIFSAASSWGPGAAGWQQCDQTWQCRDEKNALGMVTQEQGRVIWRVSDGTMASQPIPKVVAPKRAWFACCSRRDRRARGRAGSRSDAIMNLLNHSF